MKVARRRELVSADNPALPIARQCALLGISRSSFYYAPVGDSEINLSLMRLIDEQFLETPFYGSRQMTRHLGRLGHRVGRHHVRRLMRRMGLAAVYQRPRTSVPHPEHVVFPYLLRGLTIDRPNQVWCADITYIPMRRGFLYLVAVMDWASRKVLSWRVSNTMEVEFCIAAVADAIERFGAPEIFNTDQGSQFTSPRFVSVLRDAGISVSMDGRGRWMDNVFIERLWRSLKYECVYLHAFETTSELRSGLTSWVGLYNERRPHSGLGGRTPDEVYERVSSPAAGPGCPPAGNLARQQETTRQAA
jgi:putative transposase